MRSRVPLRERSRCSCPKPGIAGITPCRIACAVFTSAARPETTSVCPMQGFTLPRYVTSSSSSSLRSPAPSAASSALSASNELMPWVSM
ncbi:hypothetical protein SMICM304S_04549 [Streptomyces microflavus]